MLQLRAVAVAAALLASCRRRRRVAVASAVCCRWNPGFFLCFCVCVQKIEKIEVVKNLPPEMIEKSKPRFHEWKYSSIYYHYYY